MSKMSFEEYVSEMFDVHVSLSSAEDIAKYRAAYNAEMAPKAKPVNEKHRDSHLKAIELREKLERLIKRSKVAIERDSDLPITCRFVELATLALEKRPTKADMFVLIDLCSDAGREQNAKKTV